MTSSGKKQPIRKYLYMALVSDSFTADNLNGFTKVPGDEKSPSFIMYVMGLSKISVSGLSL